MHRSLAPLVADLHVRTTAALEQLNAVGNERLDGVVNTTRQRLEYFLNETAALRGQNLLNAGEAAAAFPSYEHVTHNMTELEHFLLPFVIRFGPMEEQLTAISDALLQQVRWPWPRPLIGAFSSEYYWTYPRTCVICVPSNEHRRLLGLPDLCHEYGHDAIERDPLNFIGDFLDLALDYARNASAAPPPTVSDPVRFYTELFTAWRSWMIEFACDAIGTYLVGEAYAWQHLRLRCLSQGATEIYEPLSGASHPADDARMRLIASVLRQLGRETQADDVVNHWQGLIAQLHHLPGALYEHIYPDVLLDGLSERVVEGCRGAGLRAYGEPDDDADIPRVVNEAWREIRHDPDGFAAWERGTYDRLLPRWREIGAQAVV